MGEIAKSGENGDGVPIVGQIIGHPHASAGSVIMLESVSTWKIVKWIAGLLSTIGVILITAMGYLVYVFFDMRAKVETVGDRIKSEVMARSDDIRKELMGESKKLQGELELLTDCIEVSQSITDLVCKGHNEAAINEYTWLVARIKPKSVPDAMKASIYRSILNASYNGRIFGFLKEGEIDEIEAMMRKNLTSCGAMAVHQLSVIHLANGRKEKAKGMNLAAIDMFVASRQQSATVLDLSREYALAIIIECACLADGSVAERCESVWALVKALQIKLPSDSMDIARALNDPICVWAKQHLSLSARSGFEKTVAAVEERLRKTKISVMYEQKFDGTRTIVIPKIVETDRPTAEPDRAIPITGSLSRLSSQCGCGLGQVELAQVSKVYNGQRNRSSFGQSTSKEDGNIKPQ